jgi:hypothetical protein
VVPPSHLRSDIPADVEAVVLRCLAKSPADRYPTAAALREAIFGMRCLGELDERRRRPLVAIARFVRRTGRSNGVGGVLGRVLRLKACRRGRFLDRRAGHPLATQPEVYLTSDPSNHRTAHSPTK